MLLFLYVHIVYCKTTRDSRPETRDLRPETRDSRYRNERPEARNERLEARDERPRVPQRGLGSNNGRVPIAV